ncbi:MAG: ATP-binding cassette domain-containing protein [Ahrensia sp.]|nr:ATP-binding cassette domain-containing protein [Ahrensia sp.]
MSATQTYEKNTSHAATIPPYLSVHDLHAYYGESYIVQGVSFNVYEGEIIALLGRNGAGKTSTLRAIARLDAPEARKGEIWLDHKPLHKMKSHEASVAGIALVPEDRRIIAGLTVEENLKLAQIVEPVGWSLERIYGLFPMPWRAPQAGGCDAFRRRATNASDCPCTCARYQGFIA